MTWDERLPNAEGVINWLLEAEEPGARYLTLRDLSKLSPDEETLVEARQRAHREGPISTILDSMHEDGYWVQPGSGYYPKYQGTVWSLITLAQLGASVQMDARIGRACAYLMNNALTEAGHITISGSPSGTADCLQGNMCHAFTVLGFDDPRLDQAYEWMARSVTGEGVAPKEDRNASLRFYASKCGPLFACGSNNKLPCAWGGVKVMLAFSVLPSERRTSLIDHAIQQGVDFLLGTNPALAEYPMGWNEKPSRNWWKFGFPVFYITDLLQNIEALVNLGYGDDPRLAEALDLIFGKQDEQGRWKMEYSYAGKIIADFGAKNEPNKWVTLRAMRVLQAIN